MSRADAYRTTVESPVKKYLSWSSNDKCFNFYDKETKENKKLTLPLTLIHLDELSTVKGWHDSSSSGIYSNEVRSTKNEELNVRAFKGGDLAKGIYQDIKLKVQSLGGHYCVSIYAFADNEIVNVSLKGSALMAWSDFTKDNRKSFLGNTIEVLTASEGKKGAVKFYSPVFTLGAPIALSDSEKAEDAYTLLKSYLDAKKVQPELPVEAVVAENIAFHNSVPEFPVLENATDDLPF
jgi:hypothetical protein